jgi:hypothetical protein
MHKLLMIVVLSMPLRFPAECGALADRLSVRGSSVLPADQPELQGDMRLAGRVIRALIRSFNFGDVVQL